MTNACGVFEDVSRERHRAHGSRPRPRRSVNPSMIEASSETEPSSRSTDPTPASNAGSSSSACTAASTASSALPPDSRSSHARERARSRPALCSGRSASGRSLAPPWMIRETRVLARAMSRTTLAAAGADPKHLRWGLFEDFRTVYGPWPDSCDGFRNEIPCPIRVQPGWSGRAPFARVLAAFSTSTFRLPSSQHEHCPGHVLRHPAVALAGGDPRQCRAADRPRNGHGCLLDLPVDPKDHRLRLMATQGLDKAALGR
jgi:hypothetical protein